MDENLAGLNGAQRCAVSSPASVLQVLAPPGSGKTKTLTSRVAHLITVCGLKPWNIIVCTFTIKAARDMKERIRGFVGDGIGSRLLLGTFHSVARRFLHSYGHFIGIDKNFGIADSSDSLAVLKRIVKDRNYSAEPKVARSRISGLKARSISCEEYAVTTKQVEQQEFAAIYSEYEERLKISNLLDYDDLLLRCVELLRRRPECVSNIEAVLIDEFQDTNHVQYDLMRLMAQHRNNITIVGDPDQSIYSFRSAEIKNLGKMRQQYPETVVVILEENYRSSAAILQSALEVIEQDQSRPVKKLLPTHCAGELPVLRRLPSADIEATWLVTEIKRTKALTGNLLKNSDFAVLLRSAALSRYIEAALVKSGTPYRMVGGLRFFDRAEVKLLLDYLRVIHKPDHTDALVRIINTPSRKVGDVTINALLTEAEGQKDTIWSLILGTAQGNKRPKAKLTSQAKKGLEEFVNVIISSRKRFASVEGCSVADLLLYVMKKISFEDYLKKSKPEDFDSRWANVEELIAQAKDASTSSAAELRALEEALPQIEGVEQRDVSAPEDSLAGFLANVALSTEVQQGEGTETDQVTISTIHAAKGLEWPVVFIPGAYEGSIPHSRAEDTDEERRLLYVGMTRAQSLLYLSCPVKNSMKEETTLSPFLSDRKLARFFDAKGPVIGHTATQNLARILRRDCPSEAEIQQGRESIERPEDDLYPINGDNLTAENMNWDFKNNSNNRTGTGHRTKRQKLDADERVPVDLAGTGVAVTMQHPENFSIGFMSAGARMKEIQDNMEANAASRIEQKAAHQETIKQTKTSMSTRQPGQGSITSFFGRASVKPKTNTDDQIQDAIRATRRKHQQDRQQTDRHQQDRQQTDRQQIDRQQTERHQQDRQQTDRHQQDWHQQDRHQQNPYQQDRHQQDWHQQDRHQQYRHQQDQRRFVAQRTTPPQDISNTNIEQSKAPKHPTLRQQDVSTVKKKTEQPKSASAHTAPSLSTHKLSMAPMQGRPKRSPPEPQAHKPYSFLSSPPMDPADEEDEHEVPEKVQDDMPRRSPDEANELPESDFRPAATFHTTSISALSNQAGNRPKKTLGVRRTGTGWSASTGTSFQNKPFTAPARRR